MIYRTLGRTGLKVSQLGFGAMRLPMTEAGESAVVNRELAIPMLQRAFALGINYIDTAVGYCNEDSQRVVGEALKGWRDQIVVSTKNPYYGEDEKQWWTNLENSLQRLDIASIDIYNHHGVNWERYSKDVEPRVSKWMLEAKNQGLIKHICTSFHDDSAALKRIVDCGYIESVTLQYNLLNRQLEEAIAYAREKGVGVVVMGPVAGGRLAGSSDILKNLIPGIERVPELALRFVLANPHVTVALSGMGTLQMVEENAAIASDAITLTAEDIAAIEEHVKRVTEMEKLYCTGCKYCQPCPEEVNIPYIFEMYNLGKIYGLWDVAKENYAKFPQSKWIGGLQADSCVECGDCEEKCPQHLQIRALLKEAHLVLQS
jgi:predicted aldo/keto reductase-like oxidoreductase